jgi:hypothetical protein
MTKDVVKKEQNEIVDVSIFEGEVTGFEGTNASTFKTPFLKVLQAQSPELSRNNSKFIPNAQIGQFCNSASQELYNELEIIVLKVEHSLLVWKPNRGGFVGRYSHNEEKNIVSRKDGVKKWDIDGNEVVDTIEFFCVNIHDPSDIFIFPLSKASLKHANSFASRLRLLKANGKQVKVSWAGIWKISTMEEINEKGSWLTLGNTPSFIRFITAEDKENIITPTLDMLKTAETDYSVVEGEYSVEEDSVEY